MLDAKKLDIETSLEELVYLHNSYIEILLKSNRPKERKENTNNAE